MYFPHLNYYLNFDDANGSYYNKKAVLFVNSYWSWEHVIFKLKTSGYQLVTTQSGDIIYWNEKEQKIIYTILDWEIKSHEKLFY